MKLRTGVDLIELSRIDAAISRHGKRYLERVYTSAEIELCGKRVESLAGRFAAKEAVAKALGCGFRDINFKEIEILHDELDAPVLSLHDKAAKKADELGLTNWSISISHNQSQAVAFVVAID